jgi:hypothetical protein
MHDTLAHLTFLVTFTVHTSQIFVLDRDEWQYRVFLLVKLISLVVIFKGTQVIHGVEEFEIYMSKISLLRS